MSQLLSLRCPETPTNWRYGLRGFNDGSDDLEHTWWKAVLYVVSWLKQITQHIVQIWKLIIEKTSVVCPRSHIKWIAWELVQHLRKAQDEKKSASVYAPQGCDEATAPCKTLFSLIPPCTAKAQGWGLVWFSSNNPKQCGLCPPRSAASLAARARSEQNSLGAGKRRAKWAEKGGKNVVYFICMRLGNKVEKPLWEGGAAQAEWRDQHGGGL